MKLCIVPFVAVVEAVFFGNRLSPVKGAGIGTVLVGIYLVVNPSSAPTSTVLPSPLGMLIAALSVFCAGLQQISTRQLQKKYNVTPVDLLDSISWIMAASIGLVGPFFDKLVSSQWVWDYQWTTLAGTLLILSCALAVSINLSQFIFLGRMSATTFQGKPVLLHTGRAFPLCRRRSENESEQTFHQNKLSVFLPSLSPSTVVGHAKTIGVLVGGVFLFGEHVAPSQWLGCLIAMLGIIVYTSGPSIAAGGKTGTEKILSVSPAPAQPRRTSSTRLQAMQGGASA